MKTGTISTVVAAGGLAALLAASSGAGLTGCKSIESASVGGSYDPTTHTVGGSVTIHFKTAPTEATREKLLAAGARELGATVWLLPARTEAVRSALGEGATLSAGK